MGRHTTGATTTIASNRIELSHLLKYKYIEKNKQKALSLSWTDDSEITLSTSYLPDKMWIRLAYVITDMRCGKKKSYDYKIGLTSLPSNLGKGEVLYFICPVSGKRCRILYRCYGYEKWKSRDAYQNRIYYPLQKSSKYDWANDKYWALEREIEAIRKQKYFKWSYAGKTTQKALRLQEKIKERDYYDHLRWTDKFLPQSILSDPLLECFIGRRF